VTKTLECVKAILKYQLVLDQREVAGITTITQIRELNADSLDILELAMCCEEEFNIEIPDEVCSNLLTVGDLVVWIDKERSK